MQVSENAPWLQIPIFIKKYKERKSSLNPQADSKIVHWVGIIASTLDLCLKPGRLAGRFKTNPRGLYVSEEEDRFLSAQ
jgi:hypothetical protein